MKEIQNIYNKLLKTYGPQGWWPLLELHKTHNKNPTKSGSIRGYHPNDYKYPKTTNQQYEICLGAILTQNTSWPQVEAALLNLRKLKLITPKNILTTNENIIKQAIKPSGYYNQKYKKIILFTKYFQNIIKSKQAPTRAELLNIWGIGPETADSILLFAFKQPEFIIDSYTKRILTKLELITKQTTYEEIKNLFENNLKKDYKVYQEYHALLVEHAKNHYNKKPYGQTDKILT